MKPIHDLAGLCASVGLTSALIGILDRLTSQGEIGPFMLIAGSAVFAISVITLGVTSRTYSLRSPLILAGGVFPFAAFGLFLVWRIGLSAEQTRDCHEGDAIACRTLGERRFKRQKFNDARVLLEAGCELGDADSCMFSASVEKLLNGDETDHYRSLLKNGCELGSGLSCYRIYLTMEENQDAATRGQRRAGELESLLRRACALDYRPACVDSERSEVSY